MLFIQFKLSFIDVFIRREEVAESLLAAALP